MDSNLTRRRFLEGSAALLGVSLVGCGGKEPGAPQAVSGPGGSITLTGLAEIAPGSALAFDFPNGEPGLLYVTKSGKSGAVSAKCTHLGCTVEWNAEADEQMPLRCPCHESFFSLDGTVLGGPAEAPLTRYVVTRSGSEAKLKPL
jgi:cytochrome b6-f complex iron-sulfur subunit